MGNAASMVNKISCNSRLGNSPVQQLGTDTSIEVTIDIPFAFRAIPVEVIESTGTLVLEQLLRIMLPRFLMQIIQEITGFGEAGRSCGMMLRKKSQPSQKDQSKMADSASDPGFSCQSMMQKGKSTSFFSVSRLFVGFCTKGLSDSDSARSPTSPLDFKVFSNLGTPFVRSPRSPGLDAPRKSWDCNRVGLGLVD